MGGSKNGEKGRKNGNGNCNFFLVVVNPEGTVIDARI